MKYYTRKEIIDAFINFYNETGSIPKRDDIKISKRQICNLFGTFTNALKESKLKYSEITEIICKNCEKLVVKNVYKGVKDKTPIFCSKTCSLDFLNTKTCTKKRNLNISKGMTMAPHCSLYLINCKECNNLFACGKKRKTCSKECLTKNKTRNGIIIGRKTASKYIKRSKNEIELHNLLFAKYCDTIHNISMFNGWDADIIIPSKKLAIMWNGPCHYNKITEKHSVIQVQNRDFIKLKEIDNFNYKCIVIKDYNNKMTPNKAFEKIEELINDSSIGHLTIY